MLVMGKIVAGTLLAQFVTSTGWAWQEAENISKTVLERGAHHQRIKVEQTVKLPGGKSSKESFEYTEIGAGLNRLENGNWVRSREVLERHPLGLVGRSGPFQVIFMHDINRLGSVDILTPDKKRLASTVLGLFITDVITGESVIIGEVKDSRAKWLPPNQVIYEDAFLGINADVRYTYAQGYFEQDVILREKPVLPEGFDPETTLLKVLTEFVEAPEPEVKSVKPGGMNLDDGGDMKISFGAVQFGQSVGFKEGKKGVKAVIAKDWLQIKERRFLLETVPYKEMEPIMEGLKESGQNGGREKTAKLEELIPQKRVHPEKETGTKEVEVASLSKGEGAVLDFVFVYTTPYITFASDETYYIHGMVWVDMYCEFQEGTVVKYDEGGSLVIGGQLVCPKPEERPAVLTGLSDNTYGIEMFGYKQDVERYWAEKALVFYMTGLSPYVSGPQQVTNLDIRDAVTAIELYGDNELRIKHSVIEHCQKAIYNSYENNTICNYDSGAIYEVIEEVDGDSPTIRISRNVIRGGKELNISNSEENQAEVDIVINPQNQNNIFALAMYDKTKNKKLRMMESNDGGISWRQQDYTDKNAFCDPSLSFSSSGDLWFTFIGSEELIGKTVAVVNVRRKGDLGFTFDTVADCSEDGVDRPTVICLPRPILAEDLSGEVYYEAWWCLSKGGATSSLSIKRLTNDLKINNEEDFIDLIGSDGAKFSYLDISENLLVLAPHCWIDPAPTSVTVQSYRNQTAEMLNYSTFRINMPVDYFPPALSQSGGGISAEVGVGLDRINKKIHIVFSNKNTTDIHDYDSDIYIRSSLTQVESKYLQWDNIKKVNKFGLGKTQFMPRMAVDSKTGNIAIAWYGCNDIANTKPHLYIAISKDQGITFEQARVSRGISDHRSNDDNNSFDYGDFIGIAFHNGVVFPAWADNSNSTGYDTKNVLKQDGKKQIEFQIHTRKIVVMEEIK